jgi:hypothetical protein
MHHIATLLGTGAAGSFSFSNIPQNFTHLQLRIYGRNYTTGTGIFHYFNGDAAGTNYATHLLRGNGSTSVCAAATSQPYYGWDETISQSSSTANVYGVSITDIVDYQNTSKFKTVKNLSALELGTAGSVSMWTGLYMSTSAITSWTITPGFDINSRADLYGMISTTLAGT